MSEAVTPVFLAINFGHEQGRAAAGWLDAGTRLMVEEVHRFQVSQIEAAGYARWDAFALWSEILQALAIAGERYGARLASVGLTSPGSDFGLLTDEDILLGNPFYGPRHAGQGGGYRQVGCARQPGSTLAQLSAMVERDAPELPLAHRLLPLPALYNFWLCGRKAVDEVTASAMGGYDLASGGWARELMDSLGIPARLFGELVPTGSILGRLRDDACQEAGCPPISVVAVPADRGAAALEAAQALDADALALLLGAGAALAAPLPAPFPEPPVQPEAAAAGVCPQRRADGGLRAVVALPGLALLERLGSDAAHLQQAQSAPAFGPLVPPEMIEPADWMEGTREVCLDTGQRPPETPGEAARCLLESIALECRRAAETLGGFTRLPARITLVRELDGAEVLAHLVAGATGKAVRFAAFEAAVAGSLLSQAAALGAVEDASDKQELMSRSFETRVFQPESVSEWEQAYRRYLDIRSKLEDWQA